MPTFKRPLPPWIQVRPGRRWPRRPPRVLDDNVLGHDWSEELERDDGSSREEEPTRVRRASAVSYDTVRLRPV